MTKQAPRRCRLYLIAPPAFGPETFPDTLARALGGGDVACIQVRLKDASDDKIRRSTEAIARLTHAADVALVMNDRPDLAAELACDGVHIGQDDTSYAQARRIVGPDAIIGVTCHNSRHLAMEAAEKGADYVAFGAFFPTTTKQAKSRADPDILTWWQEIMGSPCVAIGGITVENGASLVAAGADFLAVSSGVWNHPGGPEQAVRRFNDIFDANSG